MATKDTGSAAVVVLGSLHYDVMVEAPNRPIKGETLTGTRWYPKFGGKGGNQAIAAKLHGADVRLISATGTDNFSDYLHARLKQAGISSSYIARLENEATGMSVAIQDAEGDYGAVIVSGANLAISPRVFELAALWNNAAILLLQNEVPESLNLIAARMAKQRDILVCINAAPARNMSQELIALVDILIVNSIEAEALTGDEVSSLASAAKAARKLSSQCPTVIVTAGDEGVAAFSGSHGAMEVSGKHVEVVSTHGAGDVFTGVICAELAIGTALDAAIEIANISAADHVSRVWRSNSI